jgi:N-acyl amino acid synthase of PEP-CTERM/exosortase system
VIDPSAIAAPYFRAAAIDDAPELMKEHYRLRYQVYCLERKFLPAANFPEALEMDDFDRHAVHVGAIDACGVLAGTARVVKVTAAGPGLPLFQHCKIFAEETELLDPDNTVVEISRLSMSRRYRRSSLDGRAERREVRRDVFLALFKAVYQATKRLDATHWVAATETSLQRLLAHYGFPFRAIGPECDYGGRVSPYLMNLVEFDQVILSRRVPELDEIIVGLEPQYRPRSNRTTQPLGVGDPLCDVHRFADRLVESV